MLINKKQQFALLHIAILSSVLLSSNIHACEAKLLSLELVNSNAPSYDVFSSEAYALTQQYEVKTIFSANSNPEDCAFYVTVSSYDSTRKMMSTNNETLLFEPYPQASNSGLLHNYWYGQVTPNSEKFRFQLRFPGRQFAPQGKYEVRLEAKLLSNLTATNIEGEISQIATANIDSAVKINFFGLADNSYHLNLGELTTGKAIDLSPYLFIQSTSGYSLSFDSINQGHLRHKNQLAQWDIGYQLTLNSTEIDLSSNSRQYYSNRSTGISGDRMPLKIIVGETEMKPAGTYTDEVHIYVTPNGIVNE